MEQAWRLLERYEKRATSAYYKGIETLRKLQNDRKREPAQELKENMEKERYLRRTVAPKMASFSTPENLDTATGSSIPRAAASLSTLPCPNSTTTLNLDYNVRCPTQASPTQAFEEL